MFSQLSKFNCVSETNQTNNQNFSTPFSRGRCQEDIVILIAFSRSDPTRNDLISEALYLGDITRFIT